MPRTATAAKPSRPKLAPWRFALAAVAAYALLILPVLAVRHFDPSVFVFAGDQWVDPGKATPGLIVKPNSGGYDGQFYYRLAQHPFDAAPQAGGIAFDHPAKRMQRILYPLLVWLVSFGHKAATAWALLGVNLAGLGAIAWLGCRLARRLDLPAAAPVALMLWPGFAITLMRDTTEITAAAFVLGALECWLSDRVLLFVGCAACAALARETTLPLIGGLMIGEMLAMRRHKVFRCAAALVPFKLWQTEVARLTHEAPQAHAMAHDLGWPLAGAARMLWDCLTGGRSWGSTPGKDILLRAVVLLTAPALLAFCVAVATRLPLAWRDPRLRGLVLGWGLTAGLMSLLSATGPWVDTIAYFRAFTECYVLGIPLLFRRAPPRPILAIAGAQFVLACTVCVVQLR